MCVSYSLLNANESFCNTGLILYEKQNENPYKQLKANFTSTGNVKRNNFIDVLFALFRACARASHTQTPQPHALFLHSKLIQLIAQRTKRTDNHKLRLPHQMNQLEASKYSNKLCGHTAKVRQLLQTAAAAAASYDEQRERNILKRLIKSVF